MSVEKNQLQVPPAAQDDAESYEILRLWGAGGQQHVVLNPHLWEDPRAWGIVLANLAEHVANSYEQLESRDRQETLRLIVQGFEGELHRPTGQAQGSIPE